MSETPLPGSARPRQVLRERIFWFLVGSVANYLLISTPFHWLKGHTALSEYAISRCSLGFSAAIFFLWNYFVNFRTETRKRQAFPRYLGAVVGMWFLSSQLLGWLKLHDFHHAFSLVGHKLDLDIITTQVALGGLKFLLYHFWVFPRAKAAGPSLDEPAA